MLHRGVYVVDVQVQRDGRAFERLRPQAAPFGKIIHQHQHGITDAHGRVHDLAVRAGQARQLFGVEGFLVEGDGVGSAFADDVRGQRVHAGGNGRGGGRCHDASPKTVE
ncbi:hypothetical protein D3C87_1642770 [compost metagenome]